MIDISIFHKANPAGDNLTKLLQENFDLVDYEEINIEDNAFIKVNIKNEQSKYERVINPPQSQLNCIDRNIMFRILGQNGISYLRTSKRFIRRYYEVLVFDISIISIKQRILGRVRNPIHYIKQVQCLEAAEMSKKAVYHLGLNFAMVKIALTANKEYKVVNVDTSPPVRSKDLEKVIIKLKRIYQIEAVLMTEREVKLGADPEFMLSKSSKMVAASRYFPHHGRVGCDNIRTSNKQQRPIAELRPQPSISPLELTENVKTALFSAAKMAPHRNIKWVAGSQPFNGYPIGGHIHFSNTKLSFAVLRSLDNFVAIPLCMIENNRSARLRRQRYGALADYRLKKYGGFEYRTLASWLVSPEITKAVLCLAKIAISCYLDLDQNYLASVEAQRAFYKGNREYFKPIFDDLWSRISETDMYPQYANELQVLCDMINDDLHWNEKDDIRKAWQMIGILKRKKSIFKKRTIKIKRTHMSTSRNTRRRSVHSRNVRSRNVQSRSSAVASRPSHNTVVARLSEYRNSRNRAAVSPGNQIGNRRFNSQRNSSRSSYTMNF